MEFVFDFLGDSVLVSSPTCGLVWFSFCFYIFRFICKHFRTGVFVMADICSKEFHVILRRPLAILIGFCTFGCPLSCDLVL